MNLLRRARITTQLYSAFGLLLGITLILAVFAVERVNMIEGALSTANTVRATQLEPLYVAREALDQTGIAARNAYIFEDEQAALKELDIMDARKSDYLAALSNLDTALAREPLYEKVKAGMLEMASALNRPRACRTHGDMDAFGLFLVNECSPLRRQIVADVDALLHSLQQRNAATSAAASAEAFNA